MSLSKRITANVGTVVPTPALSVEQSGLAFLQADSPASPKYEAPAGDTPRQVVRWMIKCQREMYGTSIDLSESILIRNMRPLLKKYTPRQVKRVIFLCSWKSKHPFSTKYIRTLLEELYPERVQVESLF